MSFFGNLFKGRPAFDFREIVSRGALIIDVRSPGEFSQGHIKGSINVPLQNIAAYSKKFSKEKSIITCCASGMRSASAKSILTNLGFQAYNGGPWSSLDRQLK
ncbi:MAG: hypothetical protein RL634_1991 [Bacteroidota bacterium]|jgi:phage shock protein E|nr:rhodanese-like domain-containing protein [Chitinophagia bacterium]